MNILRKPETASDIVRVIGLRLCKFANGECECAGRARICARVEGEAEAIVALVRKSEGGPDV